MRNNLSYGLGLLLGLLFITSVQARTNTTSMAPFFESNEGTSSESFRWRAPSFFSFGFLSVYTRSGAFPFLMAENTLNSSGVSNRNTFFPMATATEEKSLGSIRNTDASLSKSSQAFPSFLKGSSLDTEIPDKISGISLVSPANKVNDNWTSSVQEINAEWAAILPYGFSYAGSPKVMYNTERQWWGERVEGMTELIRHAHNNGIKVMLKPMVWVVGGWPGDYQLNKESKWEFWC